MLMPQAVHRFYDTIFQSVALIRNEFFRLHSADINGIDNKSITNFERYKGLAVYISYYSNDFLISVSESV
jgi:hypothetical protein